MQKNMGLDVLSEDEAIYYSKKLVLLSPHHSPLCHAPEDHNVNISRTGFGMGSE
jgi:hypothetical protein